MEVNGLNQITQKWFRAMPIKAKTERDAEGARLLEFVKEKRPESLLDVGCAASWLSYAPELRKLVKRYDGIDLVEDEKMKPYLDFYHVGDAIDFEKSNRFFDKPYEMVACVSTIEHTNLSSKKKAWLEPEEERKKMFKRCLDLAEKWFWISFPVGRKYRYLEEFEIITDKELVFYEGMCFGYKLEERFYYTQGSQVDHPWLEHRMRNLAVKIPFLEYIGNQSLCVMEVEKC